MNFALIFIYFKAISFAFLLFFTPFFIYKFFFKYILKGKILELLDKRIRLPFFILMIFIGIMVLLKFLPEELNKTHYENYAGFLKNIAVIILGIEVTLFLIFDYIWVKRVTTVFPTIFRDIIKFVIYVTVIIFVLDSVKINITPFLTTAGILTMVIGLALQDTLGNVFAGLAMQFSSPFNPGDIIDTGDLQGKVSRIDWRSTYIITRTGDYIVVPHSVMSKLEIKNFSQPTKITSRIIHVGVSYEAPPPKVIKVIKSVLREMKEVSKERKVRVMVEDFKDFAVNYEIEFPVEMKGLSYCEYVEGKLLERLWFRFKQNNIAIPFPIRDIYHRPAPKEEEKTCILVPFLKKVDFLSHLSDEKLRHLARSSTIEYYTEGETICNYGEQGYTFYIIKTGTVDVYIPINRDESVVSTLREEDFFGEISLLTGEPRTATVKVSENAEFIVLSKEAFVKLIKEDPEIAETMSRVISSRHSSTKEYTRERITTLLTKEENDEKERSKDTLRKQLFTKIRKFFSIEL